MEGQLPLVSVVVLNWNSGAYLEEALRSVLNQAGARVELVAVDSGSTNGSLDILRRLHASGSISTLIELGQNDGYAAGMNAGLARTTGKIVIPMNSDVVVSAGFAEAMGQYVEARDAAGHPIGMVAVPVYEWVYEEGGASTLTDRLTSVGAVVMRRFTSNAWHPAYDSVDRLMGPEGSVPVYMRAALDAAYARDGHYFEPGYFAYGEDVDLMMRVREAGFAVAVETSVRAWHIGSASSGGALSVLQKPLWLRSIIHLNRYKTLKKLPRFWERLHARAVLLIEDAFWVMAGPERLATASQFVRNYVRVATVYRPRRLSALPVRLGGAGRSATSRRLVRGERLPAVGR